MWRRHQPVTGVLLFMTLKDSLLWGKAELWARWDFLAMLAFWHFRCISKFFFFQASTVSPLVTIVIPYPGSYSGPWLNSEHLAAALAAAVFYLAFSSRYLPTVILTLLLDTKKTETFILKDCTMWLVPTSALPRNQNIFQTAGWQNRNIEHILFQVQSFGLSLASGEKGNRRRRRR